MVVSLVTDEQTNGQENITAVGPGIGIICVSMQNIAACGRARNGCTSGVSVGYFVLLRVVGPGMAVPPVSVWGILCCCVW